VDRFDIVRSGRVQVRLAAVRTFDDSRPEKELQVTDWALIEMNLRLRRCTLARRFVGTVAVVTSFLRLSRDVVMLSLSLLPLMRCSRLLWLRWRGYSEVRISPFPPPFALADPYELPTALESILKKEPPSHVFEPHVFVKEAVGGRGGLWERPRLWHDRAHELACRGFLQMAERTIGRDAMQLPA
jgi:hypothetical protein